jgi:hypothetical protein
MISLIASGNPADAVRPLSSGTVGFVWDWFSGEGFTGKSFDGDPIFDSPENFAMYTMEQLAPFVAQEIPEISRQIGGAVEERDPVLAGRAAVSSFTQFFGIKATPWGYKDLEQIVAKEKGWDPYHLLEGQRDEIARDPKVIKYKKRLDDREKVGDPLSNAFDQYRVEMGHLENKLHNEIVAHANGEYLSRLINEFKNDRFKEAQQLFGKEDVVEHMEKKENQYLLADKFAAEYWGVSLPHDPGTDFYDYKQQEHERNVIRVEAERAGITKEFLESRDMSPDYITGKGPGTFRGASNIEDHLVRNIVEIFDADHDNPMMQAYWQVPEQLAREAGMSDAYEAYLKAPNRSDWLQANTNTARTFKTFNAVVRKRRDEMRRLNPQLEIDLYKWGHVDTVRNLEVKAFLDWWRNQGQTFGIEDRLGIDSVLEEWLRERRGESLSPTR